MEEIGRGSFATVYKAAYAVSMMKTTFFSHLSHIYTYYCPFPKVLRLLEILGFVSVDADPFGR